MKSIRAKLIIVYSLIFVALSLTVASSYIAIDTQKQHMILTELLSKQKLLIERVTFTTINTAEIGLVNPGRFIENRTEYVDSVTTYKTGVNFMLEAFTQLEYPLDGKIVRLKFRNAFLPIFNDAIKSSREQWQSVENDVDWLLNPVNLDDLNVYESRLDDFRQSNNSLIYHSDFLTETCRIEANHKKNISTWIQILSIITSLVIYLFLIGFIKNHFEKPIQQIRTVFSDMSKGNFDKRLDRSQEDEFQALFKDFNRFVDSLLSIRRIENHILSEDHLSNNLSFIQKNFRPFVIYDQIHLFYENTRGAKIQMTQNDEETTYQTVEYVHHYNEITQIDSQNIVFPIQVNDVYLGYAQFTSSENFDDSAIMFFNFLKEKLIFAFYKSLLFKDLLAIVTDGLADLAESRDPETRQHLIRMSTYSELIATQLQKNPKYTQDIDQTFIENIKLTSPMHDIGKVSVPDSILLKPGKLSDEEFDIMKTHAFEGGVVLKKIHERFGKFNLNYFKMAADIAHYHQEKFDGSGYPNGVSGDSIPIAARISSLADVFDALTSKRPYKEAFSLEKSYEIIRESIGSHFDPDIAEAFFEMQNEIESIYHAYKEV